MRLRFSGGYCLCERQSRAQQEAYPVRLHSLTGNEYFAQNQELEYANLLANMMNLLLIVKIALTKAQRRHMIIYG